MAAISIASVSIPNWEVGSDVELRIYPLQSFVAADGSLLAAGIPSEDSAQNNNFFERVACALAGTTLTVAACALVSTTDSLDNAAAQYGAFFFTSEGQRIGAFAEFASFGLSDTPTSTTWKDIAIAQSEAS